MQLQPYKWSRSSEQKLLTLDPVLRRVVYLSLRNSPFDITVVHGWRDQRAQDELHRTGFSKLAWPMSKHNHTQHISGEDVPWSLAVDLAPIVAGRVPWNDEYTFARLAGVVQSSGKQLGVMIRWGGDWDRDNDSTDQTFMDLGHFEIDQASS